MKEHHPHRPRIRAVRREIVPPRGKRRRKRNRLAGMLRALFLTALLGFGGWYLLQLGGEPVEPAVVTAEMGVLEDALEVDALVVRRETVVTSPASGQVYRLAEEGERRRRGTPVVQVGPAAGGPGAGNTASTSGPDTSQLAGPAPSADSFGGYVPLSASRYPKSQAQLEYDRLSEEIYQRAVALSQALWTGEGGDPDAIQAELYELVRRQIALVSQLPASGPPAAPPPGQDVPGESTPSQGTPAQNAPGPDATGPTPPGIGQTGPDPASPPAQDPAGPPDEGLVVTTDTSGLILYQVDGLEELLDISGAGAWSPSWFKSLPLPDVRSTASGQVSAGEPLFKVVDDANLEVLFLVPAESVPLAKRAEMAQDGVPVRIPTRENPVSGYLRGAFEEDGELLVRLELDVPSSEALQVRRMRLRLELGRVEGLLVPRSAVDVRDGVTGVWVQTVDGPRFTKVKVLGGSLAEVAVEGDLTAGAQVLRVPPSTP